MEERREREDTEEQKAVEGLVQVELILSDLSDVFLPRDPQFPNSETGCKGSSLVRGPPWDTNLQDLQTPAWCLLLAPSIGHFELHPRV